MLTCYHCGTQFSDDYIKALHAAVPDDGLPMTRHGEAGKLLQTPDLCEACRALPPKQLAKILEEMIELTLRKHGGELT